MKLTDRVDMPRSEWENLIDEWIFSERDRKILKRRLLDGVCYEPLAYEFDLSVQQTKSIVCRLQEKLFKHIKQPKSIQNKDFHLIVRVFVFC